MKRLLAIFLLLLCAGAVRAQSDPHVNCSQNSTCTITPSGGIPWANGNLTFIFRPLNPRVSVYIFIRNQNTTSAHTQTVTVFQTPFSQDLAPNLSSTGSRWTQDVVTQNTTANASCNAIAAANDSLAGASGLGTCYVNTMFAAQVAIRISGATAQAGSPDNFDLAIVQETGQPGGQQPGAAATQSQVQGSGAAGSPPVGFPVLVAGSDGTNVRTVNTNSGGVVATTTTNQLAFGDGLSNLNAATFNAANNSSSAAAILPEEFNGSTWDRVRGTANTGLSDAPPMQVVSDGLAQAFSVNPNGGLANPLAAFDLLAMNNNSGGKTQYLDHVVLSTNSASAVLTTIFPTSTLGTTCSTQTPQNLKFGNATTSTATIQWNCSTAPTKGTGLNSFFIPASGTVSIDLRGIVLPSGTTQGIDFVNSAGVTGNVYITLFWYEK